MFFRKKVKACARAVELDVLQSTGTKQHGTDQCAGAYTEGGHGAPTTWRTVIGYVLTHAPPVYACQPVASSGHAALGLPVLLTSDEMDV